jgi:DNA-binding NtrC family response regulator
MRKVLIVDDKENMRSFLTDVVELRQHASIEATDGEEAWKILSQKEVDLVITDIVMPNMNGLELLQKIRSIDPLLPVIVVTAYGSPETEQKVMKMGASAYLTKPFQLDEMEELLDRILPGIPDTET